MPPSVLQLRDSLPTLSGYPELPGHVPGNQAFLLHKLWGRPRTEVHL